MKSLLITLAVVNACGFVFWYFFTREGDSGEEQMARAMGFFVTLVGCVIVDLLTLMIFVIVRHFVH